MTSNTRPGNAPTRLSDPSPLVSVVVITRNEEDSITRCLESIARELVGVPGEIIVVDSASTDRTREKASAFGVRVISLGNELPLSASAGRYAGTLSSCGAFIFYVDGDMTVAAGWMKAGLAPFADERVAGVAGPFYWVYPGEQEHLGHRDHRPTGVVETLSGTAIYRRESLHKAGTFNPWMKGEEERELGYRLRQKGFVLLRIDVPMAYHFAKELVAAEADEKAMHHVGIGQIFRKYPFAVITRDLFRTYWRMFLEEAAVAAFSLICLILLFSGRPVVAGVLLLLAIIGLLALTMVKGVHKVFLFFRIRTLSFFRTLQGLGRGIPPTESYPWTPPNG
jgi:glycosyltransferase involved in cell wall biosynthesis